MHVDGMIVIELGSSCSFQILWLWPSFGKKKKIYFLSNRGYFDFELSECTLLADFFFFLNIAQFAHCYLDMQ